MQKCSEPSQQTGKHGNCGQLYNWWYETLCICVDTSLQQRYVVQCWPECGAVYHQCTALDWNLDKICSCSLVLAAQGNCTSGILPARLRLDYTGTTTCLLPSCRFLCE
eukprot:evm.model.scf_1841EXC.1 EVM.evm.TU.scf_1841EXC.1   scf_1841EXC:2658-2981(+)